MASCIVRSALAVIVVSLSARVAWAQSLCATVPDLASLAREVGGDQLEITVFAKGTQDPHFVEARPTFIKSLNQADLFVQIGLGMETGWAPPLLRSARNARIAFGSDGFVDASTVIQPLQIPTGRIDRSMGDIHGLGNPHFLVDPLNGLSVAQLIRDRLIRLRPDGRKMYEDRYEAFARKVAVGLVGESLAQKYSVEDVRKLALLYENDALTAYLTGQDEAKQLGGWLGLMQPRYGTKVIDDHNMWPYFARRFGLVVAEHLEPKPGLPPTAAHMATVIALMRRENIRVVLANAYYDPRHAQFVVNQTGGTVVNMAHQVGARPGADSYLAMIDYNVRSVAKAIESTASERR